jgi:hypothetical protein
MTEQELVKGIPFADRGEKEFEYRLRLAEWVLAQESRILGEVKEVLDDPNEHYEVMVEKAIDKINRHLDGK